MKKSLNHKNNYFVLSVFVILAAAMLASELSDSTTGMVARQRTENILVFGSCFDSIHDITPYTTTLTNCCDTAWNKPGLNNHKWVYRDSTVYC